VSITASCSVVDPYGAVCIGLGGSVVYILASRNLHSIPCYGIDGTFGTGTIDDVVDAIPLHGFVPSIVIQIYSLMRSNSFVVHIMWVAGLVVPMEFSLQDSLLPKVIGQLHITLTGLTSVLVFSTAARETCWLQISYFSLR